MARCDQGYLCDVCGLEVEGISESSLYLRYVIGWVDPEHLHTTPERHLQCDPLLAQFIVDPGFAAVAAKGEFDKRRLDERFVRQREELITRGWRRLHTLAGQEISVLEYPLPDVRPEMERRFGGGPAE